MKLTKIIALLLALSLAVLTFASCDKNEPDPDDGRQTEDGGKDETPDSGEDKGEDKDEDKDEDNGEDKGEENKDETPADPLASLDYEAIKSAPLDPLTCGSWGARASETRSVYLYFSEKEEGPYLNIVMQDLAPDYPELALWGSGGTYTVADGVITYNGETDGSSFVSKYSYEIKNGYLYMTNVGGGTCLFEKKGVKTTVFAPSLGADPDTQLMAYALAKVEDMEKAYSEKFWEIFSYYATMTYTVDQFMPENYENDDWYITVSEESVQRAAKALFGKTEIPALPEGGSVKKTDSGYEVKFVKSVFDYVFYDEYIENTDGGDFELMITLYNRNAGVPYTWTGTYRMEENENGEFDYFLTSVKYFVFEEQS